GGRGARASPLSFEDARALGPARGGAALEHRAETRPAQPGDRFARRRPAAAVLSLLHGKPGDESEGNDRAREEARAAVPERRDGRLGHRRLPAQASSPETEVKGNARSLP